MSWFTPTLDSDGSPTPFMFWPSEINTGGILPRAARPTKLGNLGERVLVEPVTKELVATDGLSSRDLSHLCAGGRKYCKANHDCS